MDMKIALAGNPNCGKTTLFNDLTGSNQYVGNWPGVTVEKKEGRLKGHKDVIIQDLPGIYSLSPYTLEEVVARDYLVKEKPDAILNIVDGTNIERNLYLTTQLIELGLPVVVAVNMMDLVRRNGDQIDAKKLSDALGCQVVEISALKGEGGVAAAELAAKMAQQKRTGELPHVFTGSVEHAIAHIEESIQGRVDDRYLRWYAVKVFERDEKVLADLDLSADLRAHLEDHIVDCEKELDDDAESIITNQRYAYINGLVSKAVKKHGEKHRLSTSDKIDQIVTNRILALPIFAVVMFAVYWIAMGPFGTFLTDWTNDVLGTAWLVEIPRAALEGWGVNEVRGGPDLRRRPGRRGRGAGLRAPDAGAVPDAGHPGGHRLHGPHRLHHGPDLPEVRPLRQELHPHAGGHRLRRPRRHGLPDHRERAGPPHDGHDHLLHPLRRQDAHHRPDRRRPVRRLRPGGRVRLLHRRGGHRHLRHHPEEDQDVRRRSRRPSSWSCPPTTSPPWATCCGPPGSGAGPSSSGPAP